VRDFVNPPNALGSDKPQESSGVDNAATFDLSRRSLLRASAISALAAPIVGGMGLSAFAPDTFANSSSPVGRKVPVLGTFGNFRQRVIGTAIPRDIPHYDWKVMFRDLPLSAHWIWGTFYDAERNIYAGTRELPPNVGNAAMIYSNRGADALHIAKECMTAYRGPAKQEKTDKGFVFRSLDYGFLGESSMVVEMGEENFRWYEKGVLEITGKPLPYATQWYQPGPVSGRGDAYVFQPIRVEGTLLGAKVDGWIGFDSFYMGSGENYQTSDLTAVGNEPGAIIIWCQFCNEYEDGSYECGAIGIGLRNWGVACGFNNKGESWTGQVIRGTFLNSEEHFPRTVQAVIYNETTGKEEVWNYTVKPKTDLVDIPKLFPDFPSPYISAEGVWRREGDKRKIKRSAGWPDYYPDDKHFRAYEKEFKS
jgi:hypothetical protein